MTDVAEALRGERGLVLVLTGAGISLASGLPTFRGTDPDAIWTKDVTEMGTLRHFHRDPVGSWLWYGKRFTAAADAKPNAAHRALAALERWQVARGGEILLVTQNIDTLHEQAGSSRLVKVHGSSDRVRCARRGCRLGEPSGTLPRAELDLGAFLRAPGPETLPRCPVCAKLLRPHVLWFDEVYAAHDDYGWERVKAAAAHMRLVLCIGTSFSVGVTDFVTGAAVAAGVPVFSIDPNPVRPANGADVLPIRAKAEELLPAVCAELGAM
jgi:NAD-dependent deacetylase